ncbi:hypothetical protein IBT49_22940 [Erwinia sp. S63]|uniref:hypothetical protein n=1 Tax=Erwinia sp. S63 TaxID=2769341 RepID=UPI00190E0CB9|nr:hypothetical protein [Erwinia sp. S63]MBK0098857.1 hypothetical protein [Erwinia sp. S63]
MELPGRPEGTHNHDAFQLMQNGLSFLQKAKNELDSDPKFAIVSFWTAVEILMKVPLVNRDWRLIVRNGKAKENISREQFTSGDFSSINLKRPVSCSELSLRSLWIRQRSLIFRLCRSTATGWCIFTMGQSLLRILMRCAMSNQMPGSPCPDLSLASGEKRSASISGEMSAL